MKEGVIAYTIQETGASPIYLCIMDEDNGQFHRFQLSQLACSRLAYECSGYVNRTLGGFNKPMPK